MLKGLIGGAGVLVYSVACGGTAAQDQAPTPGEPHLPNGAKVYNAPNVNSTLPVDFDGNEEGAPAASEEPQTLPGSGLAQPSTVEPLTAPSSLYTGSTAIHDVETSTDASATEETATQAAATGATATQATGTTQCPDSGCALMECQSGFGAYPQLDATRCLKLCDATGLLPLDSQEDVAALAAQQCEVLEEGLTVSGALVTDLAGLETIRRVGGDFVIQDTALSTLSGLSGLGQVGKTFVLSGNTELTSLEWSRFGSMGDGGLVVLSNRKLTTLDGLSGAEFPPMSVTIVDNPSLESLDGLQTLSTGISVVVAQNPSLVDVLGFQGLGSAENLTITENASLRAFELSQLSSVDSLTLADNAALTSVFLRCVGPASMVAVQNNPMLSSLMIPSLVATTLVVSANPKLPQCSIESIIEAAGTCAYCDGNNATAVCE